MRLFSGVVLLLSTSLISNDLASAQVTSWPVNPLDLFNFNPQLLGQFLWNSLKPQYGQKAMQLPVLGNTSALLEQLARQVLPENMTKAFLSSKMGQEIMDAIDTEMVSLFKNMDFSKTSIDEMMKKLMEFDGSAIRDIVMRNFLNDMQNNMSPNMTDMVTVVVSNLERDISIAPDLQMAVEKLPLKANLTEYIEHLDVALRELTKKLMADPGWTGLSELNKLRYILTKFDYVSFGRQLMRNTLWKIDNSLPASEKVMLADFLQKLNESQALNIQTSFEQGFPVVYTYLRVKMNMTLLPASLTNMDYGALQLLGVYSAIEEGLHKAMTKIERGNTSYAAWMDDKNVSDMERLVMVVTSVDYSAIGQRIMGNAMNIVEDDQQLIPLIYQQVTGLFDSMNLTTGNEQLVNKTAEILVNSLKNSLEDQRQNTNWTKWENSTRLSDLLTRVDRRSLVIKIFMAVMRQEETTLAAPMRKSIENMLSLVETGKKADITKMLNTMFDKLMMNRVQVPTQLRDSLVAEVTKQLIDTHKLIKNGSPTVATPVLDDLNMTFSQLSPTERLAYVAVSIDYSAVGQVIVAEMNKLLEQKAADVLEMLKNKQSIVEEMKTFITMVQQLFNQTAMSSPITDDLLNNINSQMIELYHKFSSDWASNSTSRDKLMHLLKHYDYMATGDILAVNLLNTMDQNIPVWMNSTIHDLINRVEQKQSVMTLLESIRTKMLTMYPSMSWMSLDVLMPLFKSLDSEIQKFSKEKMAKWNAVPGKLSKVYTLMRSLNYTQLAQAGTQSGMRLMVTAMSDPLLSMASKEMKDYMRDFMNVVESGGLKEALSDMFITMAGSNTMVKWAANSTAAHSMIDSISKAITNAYQQARDSSATEWRVLSAQHKFIKIVTRIDMRKMVTDALAAGRITLSMQLSPVYTDQCSKDLDSVTYALGNIMTNATKNMWAVKLVDAWGKLPEGLLQGRFTWPGDMNECEKVRGDRIRVVNSTTGEVVLVEKDGVKGAWSMAVISIPMQGLGFMMPMDKANLNWGVCLPASCDYVDSMKFMGRINLLGANLTYMKPRSEYPSIKGTYKTDSKFIGVSFFFLMMGALVTASTFVDYLVLRRREKRCRKEDYVMKPVTNGVKKGHENGINGVAGPQGGVDNGGYIHNEKMALSNGDLQAEPISHEPIEEVTPAKKANAKPGFFIQLLKSFSLYENLPKLMDSTVKPNQLQALDGIRFLSMSWVILGHVYAFPSMGPYTQNMASALEWGKDGDWTFSGISAGVFAVDSFFVLSGLLVGYLFLKAVDKMKGKINCLFLVLYYVHRYIRLLPLYATAIMISVAYSNYIGFGPLHTWFQGDFKNACDKHWWTNLLYINNFVEEGVGCVGWSWYLANDMQFYIISPLLLLPLYWVPKVGVVLLGALFSVHLGVTGWLWGKRDGGSQFSDQSVFSDIYIKPYCRIGPYLIGLMLAYFLFKKMKLKSMVLRAVWWLIALGTIALVVYIPYDYTKEGGIVANSWNATERAIYETLCRNAWALGLGWIIYAANSGFGGPIGDVLSWGGWSPLSRLTYAAYMVHPFIQEINYRNRHNLIYIDHIALFYDDMAFLTTTYLVAVVLHLLIEAPMLGLEKLLLPRK